MTSPRAAVALSMEHALIALGVEFEKAVPTVRGDDEVTFVVTLPGVHRLKTTVALTVGAHALTVNAFVARRPDENHEAVYRWLLERNRRLFGVAFALDGLGDIYLVGRLPLAGLDEAEIDRLLGSVLEVSDGSFNTILEMGFATSIRKEWAWRTERGLPTTNLEAFRSLADPKPE